MTTERRSYALPDGTGTTLLRWSSEADGWILDTPVLMDILASRRVATATSQVITVGPGLEYPPLDPDEQPLVRDTLDTWIPQVALAGPPAMTAVLTRPVWEAVEAVDAPSLVAPSLPVWGEDAPALEPPEWVLGAAHLLALAAPPPSTPATAATAATVPPRLPPHVAEIVLEKAEGTPCPITMEPLTKANASVSSCGHVFQTAAVKEWCLTHTTCPLCRQPCSL